MWRAVMYMYPCRRTCWSSQQGYSSMTSSGLSNSKISMSFLASSDGPVSSSLSDILAGSSVMRARSKLGLASISARASSMRLMTGAVLLSVRVMAMPGARSGGDRAEAASTVPASWVASSLDRSLEAPLAALILSVKRASPGTDRRRRLSDIFLRWRLSCPKRPKAWPCPCLGSTVVWARAWAGAGAPSPSALGPAMVLAMWSSSSASLSSSELWPSKRFEKSAWLPAAAIRPKMLWFMFINMPPP